MIFYIYWIVFIFTVFIEWNTVHFRVGFSKLLYRVEQIRIVWLKITIYCIFIPWVAPQARRLPRIQEVGSSILFRGWDNLYCCTSGAHGALPCKEWGITTCQLDLPSLTPVSVDGCGRLQLWVTHWTTSVALLHVVDNYWPGKQWFTIVDSRLGNSLP